MAALITQDRIDTWADFMRLISSEREPISITKTELRAAVDAVDDWLEANKTSFNSALPLPARTSLTAPQKARLLMIVVAKRHLKGS